MNLMQLLHERIIGGLKRASITKPSDWARMYRIFGPPFPGPCDFKHHPWSVEMHDAPESFIVGQKAAQMGYTEVVLNRCFAVIDLFGRSVLYVLPASNPDASDFSTSRFDPALESSPHLAQLFTNVKNVGHKRAGHANLFIRGSRSRSQLKSVPVSDIIFDEVEEMVQENITLAFERASGQPEKSIFMLSTPSIALVGINAWFNDSTQDHFFFECPLCSQMTELTFPDCLIITTDDFKSKEIFKSHLVCKECKGILEHNNKAEWLKNGVWVSSYPDRVYRGFYINQLYSMTIQPHEIATAYLKAQINPTDEQEFYNSKLGLPHEVVGARVSETDLQNCIAAGGGFKKLLSAPPDRLITMGCDIGKMIHFEIDEWTLEKPSITMDVNLLATPKVILEGKVEHFEQLDELMKRYFVKMCVVDVDPEGRKTLEFAHRWYGLVKRCRYSKGIAGRQMRIDPTESEHLINVDRTSWMDVALSRYRNKKILLPLDVSAEYRSHVQAPVRVYKRDQDGNPIGRYVKKENEPDHAAHARVYAEIALIFAVQALGSHDLRGIL